MLKQTLGLVSLGLIVACGGERADYVFDEGTVDDAMRIEPTQIASPETPVSTMPSQFDARPEPWPVEPAAAPKAHSPRERYFGQAADAHQGRGLGEACMNDRECGSGHCIGWCTQACEGDSDCDGGACAATSTGRQFCFPRCDRQADCDGFEYSLCMDARTAEGHVQRICSY